MSMCDSEEIIDNDDKLEGQYILQNALKLATHKLAAAINFFIDTNPTNSV